MHSDLIGLHPQLRAMKRSLAQTVDYDGILIDEREDDAINRIIPLVPMPSIPPTLPLPLAELQRRADICDACDNKVNLTRTRGDWPVWGVKCKLCGTCGLRSLVQPCPDKKFGGDE